MALSPEKIESILRAIIQKTVDDGQEDLLTVRYVRNKGAEWMNLDEGFFSTQDWKDRSKAFIKKTAEQLIDAKEEQPALLEVTLKPAKKEVAQIKEAPKRAADTEKSRPTKRQKKEATPSEVEEESEEGPSDISEEESESSPVSEFDDSDISDAPKPKRKSNSKPKAKAKAKAPAKRQTKKRMVESSEEDETSQSLSDVDSSDAPSLPPKKATKKVNNKRKSKEAVVDSDLDSEEEKPAKKKVVAGKKQQSKKAAVDLDEESDLVKPPRKFTPASQSRREVVNPDEESEEEKPTKLNSPTKTKSEANSAIFEDEEDSKPSAKAEIKANDSDSSEMSIVLDGAPKPKKRGSKSSTSATAKHKISSSTKKKEPPKGLTPNEALIKTLQSQLLKCGVRKIWAFELKKYDGDEKAKIRHLQGMLSDIGMKGRFSEQRAKEIKELRELQADLEAVKEGEKSWGLESGRRARGVRKSLKESSEEDEDEDGGIGNSRSASEKPSKAARAKQELAFLGDEDSESDE